MKWTQTETKEIKGKEVRTYRNEATGTECQTEFLISDKDGNRWFGFKDLRQIPYIRIAYAKHVSDLYSMGLSLKDILDWCAQEKALLKGADPEKYEKLYSLILEKEKLAKFTADPMKQHLALATVYILEDKERIDYFSDADAESKLKLWNADISLMSFFLSWHNKHITDFIKTLNKISLIALKQEKQEEESFHLPRH